MSLIIEGIGDLDTMELESNDIVLYDTMTIANGGNIPQATSTDLGGIKAEERDPETDVVEVKIDTPTAKLYTPLGKTAGVPYPGDAGAALEEVVEERELLDNKVPLSNTATHEQYPTAKSVWDTCQNIREVAEGKCRTFTLDCTVTFEKIKQAINDGMLEVLDQNGVNITEQIDNFNNIINSEFNSQNDVVEFYNGYLACGKFSGYEPGTIILYYVGAPDPSIEYLCFLHTGDVILIYNLEVPDRWFSTTDWTTENSMFHKMETEKIEPAAWGSILGTLANQADLKNALDAKSSVSATAQDTNKLSSITIDGNTYDNIPFVYSGNNFALGTINWRSSSEWTSLGLNTNVGYRATALGFNARAEGQESVAIGRDAQAKIKGLVSFDGHKDQYNDYQKTVWLRDPSKLFFRYEDLAWPNSKTSLSDYTNGKTLQDLLDGKMPIIDPPSSTTLTDAEIAIFKAGCIVKGDFLGLHNAIFLPNGKAYGDWNLYGLCAGCIADGSGVSFYTYSIGVGHNKKISLSKEIINTNFANFELKNLSSINSKALPAYPSSPSNPKALTYGTNNELSWNDLGLAVLDATNGFTETMYNIATEKGAIIKGSIGNDITDPIIFPSKRNIVGTWQSFAIFWKDSKQWFGPLINDTTNKKFNTPGAGYAWNIQGFYINGADNLNLTLKMLNGKSIPNYPSDTGTYTLKCVNGTLTWVQDS